MACAPIERFAVAASNVLLDSPQTGHARYLLCLRLSAREYSVVTEPCESVVERLTVQAESGSHKSYGVQYV